MKWVFINTGFRSGKFNMHYDEFLVSSLLNGSGSPILRVYGWNPPAISLGFNQSIENIDLNKCKFEGIDVIRRPTGGRAILHWNEITYSIVMYSEGLSVLQVYKKIGNALLRALSLMGINADLEKSQPDFQRLYKDVVSVPCFTSSAKFEILFENKKLVGSAQRRYSCSRNSEVVLQHGSILLGPEHRRLIDFLIPPNEYAISEIKSALNGKTTDISSILKRNLPFDEAVLYIKEGFEKEWQIQFSSTENFTEEMLLEKKF